MVSNSLSVKNKSGFSLMELLVTVAIIGVLSTAGVPMYRRMVAKAKKSEAKVNLGAIANVESMFQSEYNAYGNNLNIMGFSVDGDQNQMTYVLGFPDANCGETVTAASVVPGQATSWGTAILSSNPNYYNGTLRGTFGKVPAPQLDPVTNQPVTDGAGNVVPSAANTGLRVCRAGTTPSGTFTTFVATASGVLRTGVAANAAAATDIDSWTINQNRILTNVQDGS